MKTQSFTCPNCNAPLEPIIGKPIMFCPYCGSKIANDDIAFYTEDSKTARTETVTDAITKIFGTKEQRMAEKERKDEIARKNAEEARKLTPYLIILLAVVFVLLILAEHFGW